MPKSQRWLARETSTSRRLPLREASWKQTRKRCRSSARCACKPLYAPQQK